MKRHSAPSPLILCIDDHEPALRVRRMVLERAGYRVLTAADATEALRLFRAHAVDLVITDHTLQDGTATELMHRMKQLRSEVPIMLYSGATEIPDMRYADVFVSKLDPTEVVLRTVASLLNDRIEELPKAA